MKGEVSGIISGALVTYFSFSLMFGRRDFLVFFVPLVCRKVTNFSMILLQEIFFRKIHSAKKYKVLKES